jgi:hypothetical protein
MVMVAGLPFVDRHRNLSPGDICFVLDLSEYKCNGEPRRCSLILHPAFGLCETFVYEKRGTILE